MKLPTLNLTGKTTLNFLTMMLFGFRFWGLIIDVLGGFSEVLLALSFDIGKQLAGFIIDFMFLILFWFALNLVYKVTVALYLFLDFETGKEVKK